MVEINPLMNAELAFTLLTPFGLIFFLLIGFWYVLPRLYKEDFYGAITPLLLFSTLRYLALAFIVPGLSNGFEGTVSGRTARQSGFVATCRFDAEARGSRFHPVAQHLGKRDRRL
jgi:hypothetical protein